MLGGAELVEVCVPTARAGDKARFVRGVERALLDGRSGHRGPLGQGRAGRADRGADARRGACPRGPGATPGSAPAPRWTTCPREPGSAPRACAAARSCSPLGPTSRSASCTATSTPACASSAEGELDAIVLAVAGLRRLGRENEIAFSIPSRGDDSRPPARARCCCRPASGDEATLRAVDAIVDGRALRELTAERTVVSLLERDLQQPARRARRRSTWPRGQMRIDAFVGLPDGSEWIRDRLEGDSTEPTLLGAELAKRLHRRRRPRDPRPREAMA